MASAVVFGIGIALLVGSVIESVQVLKNTDTSQSETCPPHSWIYDANEHLICNTCKKRPGEIQTSYDKPY